MSRLTWAAIALVALGLWASLVPQITYPSASTDDRSSDVLTAWPGWGVQQDLGRLGGVVGDFVIWMASEPDADPRLTVVASLLDAETRGVLRQTTSYVTPAHIPVERTLRFPSYVVPEGQRLTLQLQVADYEKYAVRYQLSRQQSAYENVRLNGVPNAANGPLAFVHQVTSSGLRAAFHGEPHARLKMIVALAVSGLAALAHPRVARGPRAIGHAAIPLTRRVRAWGGPLVSQIDEPVSARATTALRRLFAVPWYPWLVAVIPILHFLASNPLHFPLTAATTALIVALLVITVAVAGLRLVLKTWHQAAAVAAVVTIVLFAYGHIERAIDGRLDDQVLFPAAVMLAAAAVGTSIRAPVPAARAVPLLNVSALILILLQGASLAGFSWTGYARQTQSEHSQATATTSHLFSQLPAAAASRPDIYYLILDGYGRHDALGDFDNSDFLKELERRGFYVASDATSNYMFSMQSLASSLNLAYLDQLQHRVPKSQRDYLDLVQNNALVEILKKLGYTYVHLQSGWSITNDSPHADILVQFTPSGVESTVLETGKPPSYPSRSVAVGAGNVSFIRELLNTTALRVVLSNSLLRESHGRYNWWAPERALQMFDYLAEPIETPGPKFVFAHILKPHKPATFDRHGNMFLSKGGDVGFSDDHDPSVPDAYIGQLIHTNLLVLRSIDGILEHSDGAAIIVIAGDHGRAGNFPRHAILAAFHLPDSGDPDIAPSVSSVNHFRYVLDRYFKLGIGLLEDRTIWHDMKHFDFSSGTQEKPG